MNNEYTGESYEGAGTMDPALLPGGSIGRALIEGIEVRSGNKWRCAFCPARARVAAQFAPSVKALSRSTAIADVSVAAQAPWQGLLPARCCCLACNRRTFPRQRLLRNA